MQRLSRSSFWAHDKGGVALTFGMVVPALIGFAGLGTDTAVWLMERNKLQAATDTAAISAAHAVQLNGGQQGATAEGRKLLQKIYGANLTDVTYSVQYPPSSGTFQGDTKAVAVIASRAQQVYFLGLFGVTDISVSTRSVAQVNSTAEACMLALSKTDDKAIDISGNSTVNLACGIASNSDSDQAVYLSGSSDTTTTGVSAVGDIYQSNGAELETNGGPKLTKSPAIADPYGAGGRNLQVPPTLPACTETKTLKINKSRTVSPGRYCGGISMTGGTTTFSPGVYYIDGGDFSANGNAAITGTGVTFVLTGTGNKIAKVDLNGNAQVSLHAPKTGTSYNGILFLQDPNASTQDCLESKINGTSDLNLSGALYFPKSDLRINGGANSAMSCLQVIANKIKITGNSKVTGVCDAASGTEKISRTTVELVE
jgi:hypothetical protein